MNNAFNELARNTLLVIGALFPIVNPLGNTPIFLTLTRGISGPHRASLARAIAMNSLVLMVASIFIGTYILAFFGISLPVVQVGGGLVVISTGWALLRRPDDDGTNEGAKRPCHEGNFMRQAFYPLTMPLTVGPGSIAVSITLGANRSEASGWHWLPVAGLLLGALAIAVSIYLSYRFAERLAEALGESAMNVVIRLSSFILVCIGVQILWNGVSTLLRSLTPAP